MHYTINHKPPHVFEYIVKCNKHDYVFTFIETKENKRLFDLKVGLYQNNRMKRWKFYRSDLKAIFKTILDIFGDEILEKRKDAKAVILQISDIKTKDGELYWKFLNAVKRKYVSRFNIYVRVDGIGFNYKFLVVKRPYDDTDVFAGKFSDIDTVVDINPRRRISVIKKKREETDRTLKVLGKQNSEFEIPEITINDIDDMSDDDAIRIAEETPRTSIDNIRKSRKKYSKEYWNEADKYSEKLNEEISFEEKSSLAYYTDEGYKDINNILRETFSGFVHENTLEHYRNIKNVFEKVEPLKSPITVLRSVAVPISYFDDMNIKEGDIFVDPGFISTSYRLFSNENIVMRIVVPAGSKVIFMGEYSSYPNEHEVLLQGGSVLKLLSKDKDNIYTFLYLGNISEVIEEQIISEVEDQLNELKKYYDIIEVGDVIIGGNVVIKKYNINNVFVRNIVTKEYSKISLNNEEFLLWSRNIDKLRKENVQEVITHDINNIGYGDAVFDKGLGTYLVCSNKMNDGGYYCTDLPEMTEFEMKHFSEYRENIVIKNPFIDEKPPLIREIDNRNISTLRSVLDSGDILFFENEMGRKVIFKINDNDVISIIEIYEEYSYDIIEIDKLEFYNIENANIDIFNVRLFDELFVDFEDIKNYEKYFIIDVERNSGKTEKILGSRIKKKDVEGKLLLRFPRLLF